jgi:hypothetical protein
MAMKNLSRLAGVRQEHNSILHRSGCRPAAAPHQGRHLNTGRASLLATRVPTETVSVI